ncbi:MAG: glycosyltransferase family 39 protein [Candidatus Omnitrophica bacterium]|nr:glycosyltransferase family 39 protein [Candidatus Omnitrophota bacterium]
MLALLLPLSLIFTAFNLNRRSALPAEDWRKSLLGSAVLLGSLIVVSTEILSLLHCLTAASLLVLWFAVGGINLYFLFGTPPSFLKKANGPPPPVCPALVRIAAYSLSEKILLALILVTILLTGIIALTAPPNNFDSMTYHMARVPHWIQNRSVAFYPTHSNRQLFTAPGAEYIILHLQILSGNDRFANSVQWASMVGSVIGAAWIAALLGAGRFGQIAAAFFAVTLPMGIAQATTTQNDYVVTFWAVSSLAFLWEYRQRHSRNAFLFSGLALGIGCLTKSTIIPALLPFVIWELRLQIKQPQNGLKNLGLLFCCLLFFSLPQGIRNYQLSANPFIPHPDVQGISVTNMSPRLAVSNVARNLALHLGTSSPETNKALWRAVKSIHAALGIGISESSITFLDIPFAIPPRNFHEDTAGNPAHLLVGLAAILFLGFLPRRLYPAGPRYLLCLLTGFLLFCLTIKWQPWHSRFHLVFFALFSPLFGIVVSRFGETSNRLLTRALVWLAAGLILFFSWPALLQNPTRSLFNTHKTSIFATPRSDQYFFMRPELRAGYKLAAQYVKQQSRKNIGLISGQESWEYPLWPLLDFGKNLRIEHIRITDKLAQKYTLKNFSPDLIIFVRDLQPLTLDEQGQHFIKTRDYGEIAVFLPDPYGTRAAANCQEHFFHTLFELQQPNPPIDSIATLLALREKLSLDYYEARSVDPDQLNKIVPQLGNEYRDKLLVGLQTRLAGFSALDQNRMNQGQSLVNQWIAFYLAHNQEIQNRWPR